MLQFDSKGYLTPYECISSTLDEMKVFFVEQIESNTRASIFEKYIQYSVELKKTLDGVPLKQWINGSFVTKKANPSDIDFVTFIGNTHINRYGNKLNNFGKQNSLKSYGVDAYLLEVFPEDSKEYFRTDFDKKEWYSWFTKTEINRRGNKYPKGFIEIIY